MQYEDEDNTERKNLMGSVRVNEDEHQERWAKLMTKDWNTQFGVTKAETRRQDLLTLYKDVNENMDIKLEGMRQLFGNGDKKRKVIKNMTQVYAR